MQVVHTLHEKKQAPEKFVILLAEEHPLTAKIQKKTLEEGGFNVCLAHTREMLFKLIQSEKIDLLMIENNFNKSDFLNSITKVKKISLNSQLKIVLTCIHPPKLKKTKTPIIDHCIVKPISQEKMIRELKQLFYKPSRNSERVAVNLDAVIFIKDKIFYTKIIDISTTGLHFVANLSNVSKVIDSNLKIEIELPKYKHPILLTGVVVRKTKEGYGLKVINVSLENKKKLIKFIEKYGSGKHLETYYL